MGVEVVVKLREQGNTYIVLYSSGRESAFCPTPAPKAIGSGFGTLPRSPAMLFITLCCYSSGRQIKQKGDNVVKVRNSIKEPCNCSTVCCPETPTLVG